MAKSLKFVVCFLGLCAVLLAQSERGSIRGSVHDPTGALIPGVKVSALNVATGVTFNTTTTDAGNYNIPQLSPGLYTVTAEKEGFRKMIRENVTVQLAGVVGLDLTLEVGSVADSVTVEAMAPTLKSETSEVSTVVSTKGFVDLPINAGGGRAPEAMLYLTPGFSGNTFDAHINGSQTLTKEMQVDGMSLVTAEISGDPRNIAFPPDVVQEMSVMGGSYPAEFGNTGGGVERMVIKSGTNQLHGSAWEFLRNEKLDSRGFYNRTRSVHHENEFGFQAGGPVFIPKVYNGKNKSFWMASINWYKNRGGAQNSLASVPIADFRSGNLSQLTDSKGNMIPIYDPLTTATAADGSLTRNVFSGNVIPTSRISSVSKNIMSYVPMPTLSSIYNNYPASGNSQANNHNFTLKGDQYLTSAHRISAMVNRGVNTDNGPYAVLPHPVESSRNGYMGEFISRATWDWTIGPSMLNQARFGFNRQHQHLVADEISTNWAQKVGISGTYNGFPIVRGWGFTNLAENQDEIQPISNTYLIADSFSWTKSKHNIKFGIDLRRLQHQSIYPSSPPSFGFSNAYTAFPTGSLLATTGSGFASFLLGGVNNGGFTINNVVSGNRMTQFASYVQDDWKVTPNLTLNLGLRWDLFTPMTEVADRMSVMDPSMPNPGAGNLPGAYVFAGRYGTGTSRLTSMQNTFHKAFGPRIGLAWKVSEKFVVRSAYGISYSAGGGLGGGNVVQLTTGFTGSANYQTKDGGLTPTFWWDGGFPQDYPRPPFIRPDLNVNTGGATIWGDKAYIPGNRQDWNFGTQYQLAPGTLLDVAYVGSKSTRLNTGAYNPDQVNPSYLYLGDTLRKNINDPAVAALGFTKPYATFNNSLAQALRPYPQYLGVGTYQSANIGNMTYNSLQVKVEHQFSKGLFLLSTYTWSKTLTDANSSMGSFFSPSARDNYNRQLEKALAVYDQPHRFVTAFNYELPIGPGKPFLKAGGVAGKFTKGWQVNGILTYGSSSPIQIGAPNTLAIFNGFNTPNTIIGVNPRTNVGGGSFDPAKDKYLNIGAFAVPAPYTYGTAGLVNPNLRGFFNLNEDVGFMKRTYIGEVMNVEFRFEMFNLLNRVVQGGPNTDITSSNFGIVSGQGNGPRTGQFALKFNF